MVVCQDSPDDWTYSGSLFCSFNCYSTLRLVYSVPKKRPYVMVSTFDHACDAFIFFAGDVAHFGAGYDIFLLYVWLQIMPIACCGGSRVRNRLLDIWPFFAYDILLILFQGLPSDSVNKHYQFHYMA